MLLVLLESPWDLLSCSWYYWKALGTSCHALGTIGKPFGTSCCALGTIEKPTKSKHAGSWFHNVSTYNEKVIEYFTKTKLVKIHFNQN
jgi:hypothetical protein